MGYALAVVFGVAEESFGRLGAAVPELHVELFVEADAAEDLVAGGGDVLVPLFCEQFTAGLASSSGSGGRRRTAAS